MHSLRTECLGVQRLDVDLTRHNKYPVGSTVDIYEYEDEYFLGSTAYDEYIPNEQELLNLATPPQYSMQTYNQPVVKVVRQTVICPHCGGEIIVENE